MKKIFYALSCMLFAGTASSQILLSEDFESGATGWTVTDGGAATGDSWAFSVGPHGSGTGTSEAWVDSDANGNGTHMIETLTSPSFDATGYATVLLDFDQVYRDVFSDDSATVEVWDGAQWLQVYMTGTSVGGFGTPDHQMIDITAYANANMQVRFIYDDADTWGWWWNVDNVIVSGANCDVVSGLNATQVGDTWADLAWTSTGTDFDIEWGAPGFTPGTGTELGSMSTTTLTETITGLMEQTDYDIYVRSDCGGGLFGNWAGPLNITTEPTFDAEFIAFQSPLSGCGLSAAESVTVELGNLGADTVLSFDVCYVIDGGTPVCETVNATILPMGTYVHTFATTADLSGVGTYSFDGYVTVTGDILNNNDTLSGVLVTSVQTVSSLPYTEDFESDNGGWTTQGGSVNNWAWGEPNSFTINSTNSCGSGSDSLVWMTNLTGAYSNNHDGYLVSPCFDFSGAATDPFIYFDLWYETESCCDEGWLEMSLDGGATWAKVGTSGTGLNWYNDGGNNWWDGTNGGWQIAGNTLTGAAGNANVVLRFVFDTDGSVTEDGFAIDNINISTSASLASVSPTALVSPGSSCGLTATETIEVEYTNSGSDPITGFDVCYSLDGGTFVCETVAATIAAGATYTHAFATTGDFSAAGSHEVVAVFTGMDISNCDDTASFTVTNKPLVNTFPHTEDFESDNGGWTAEGGSVNDWEWGEPNGPVINFSNSCGGNDSLVWMTNLTGEYSNNHDGYMVSPCYDFTSLTSDPVITFDIWYQTESCCDEGWLEVSIDGGITWTKVGTAGTGINWYNDAGNNWWDGTNGGWQTAGNTLTGTAGEADVRLRFVFDSDGSVTEDGFAIDNLFIGESSLASVAPTALLSPASACGLSATETIEAEYTNSSSDPITGFDVCYSVNGGTFVCETVTATIAAGATYTHTFATTADFSTAGTYDVVLVFAGADISSCDDTASFSVTNKLLVSSLPYSEDFEADNGGWTAEGGSVNDWMWGEPNGPIINFPNSCPANDTMVIGTNLIGDYSDNHDGSIVSPCFDFSGLTSDPIITFDIWYQTESCCDEGWLEMSIDGGATWTKVGTAGTGINWYNDAGNNWWDGTNGGWQTAGNTLTGAAGNASVSLRFVFDSDGSVTSDGFAVDNINITTGILASVAPSAVNSPMNSCTPLTATETIEVEFTNNGSEDITGFDVCFELDGGAMVCETVAATLAAGATYTHTFAATGDFSAAGVHDLTVYFSGMDISSCDDTLNSTVTISVPVDVPTTLNICEGDSAMIDAGNYDSYTWNTGETTQSITVDTAGRYIVDVIDSIGCTSMDSTDVTIDPLPMVSTTTNRDTLCTNETATLDAGAGFSAYAWSSGGTAQQETVDAAVLGIGTHDVMVTVTDANGCMNMDTTTLVVDNCVSGIGEWSTAAIQMYPNPAEELVVIDGLKKGADVILYNVLGAETMRATATSSQHTMDVSGIHPGTYMVTIQLDGVRRTLRLIVR